MSFYLERLRRRIEKLKKGDLISADDAIRNYIRRIDGSNSRERNLNIELELAGNLPYVYDFNQRRKLRHILLQLLDGCWAHAGRYGYKDVTIRSRLEGEFIYIDVDDNGPGVKNLNELKETLFTTRFHGGLSSLALACSSALDLGGLIIPSNIENEGGEVLGARFTVQLPLDREKMNRTHAEQLRYQIGKELGYSVWLEEER